MAKREGKNWVARKSVSGSFVAGMASLLPTNSSAHAAMRKHVSGKTASQALRGDMNKVGGDLRRVIIKERRRERNAG